MHDILIALSDKLSSLALFGGVALVLFLEAIAPFRRTEASGLLRWGNHTVLAILNQWIQLFAWPWIILAYSALPLSWPGILSKVHAGPAQSLVITLLSLELVGYWWHRVSHRLPWLWRLHAVHHSDIEVDATTSFRHHPLEVLFGNVTNLSVILFLGTEPLIALACSTLSIAWDAVTHGNITLGKADRWMRYFLVTPDFHRVHHSADKRFTDSNYSNNFPLFDYVFGTAVHWPREQQVSLPLGLGYFREHREIWLDRLLMQPLLTRETKTRKDSFSAI